MTTDEQLKRLENDIAGFINDFENGITEKENTIRDICYYIIERCQVAVKNSHQNKPQK